MAGRGKRLRLGYGPALILAWLLAVGLYHSGKPLPEGLSHRGTAHTLPLRDIVFLADLTFRDRSGSTAHEQQIFDALIEGIEGAEEYVLLDMFLFNSLGTGERAPLRPLAGELSDRLVEKKRRRPSMVVDFITDPINTVYGGGSCAELERLRQGGVNVVVTDLRPLRDSNPSYSALWRTFWQWLGNSDRGGLLPHPFSRAAAGVTLRSWLDMLNFKANHRKVFTADSGSSMTGIVTSANAHDASSAHSNVALSLRGELWRELHEAEEAVARLSGAALGRLPGVAPAAGDAGGEAGEVTFLTEGRIKEELLNVIEGSAGGDEVWIAVFYLSDRQVIEALLEAAAGGAVVRVILDPNRDAFGFEKNGIPNRPVARELVERSGGRIEVRWYETHGEQFHTKMLFTDGDDGRSDLILGSANFTRRNLDDYNLELDVKVSARGDRPPMTDVRGYLERIWGNEDGRFTLPYETFADDTSWKTVLYRVQEFSGLCSF